MAIADRPPVAYYLHGIYLFQEQLYSKTEFEFFYPKVMVINIESENENLKMKILNMGLHEGDDS